ncbi:MAG: type II toxin-antitoxin system RelE/ParE family toxin [Sphaerochaeta sp.]|nr:type II toxin-antitoxin system RelE/ParE family toxin [Sphaerochaeta sp.]
MRYISRTLLNRQAAEALAEHFFFTAERVGENPYVAAVYYPIKPLSRDYRMVMVDTNCMFYWVDELEKKVTIARVLYARRNSGSLLDTR